MATRDAPALLDAMRRLRAGASDYTTNCFASSSQLQAWLDDGRVSSAAAPGAIVVFRRDRDFHHVLHAATDRHALGAALDRLTAAGPATPLSADLVGTRQDVNPIAATYAEAGFAARAELVRMSRAGSPVPAAARDAAVEFATPGDAPMVLAFLERLLDRFTEQIPNLQELEAAIARDTVVVTKTGSGVAGVVQFERLGLTGVLRYWWLDPDVRERGLGSRLLREFFRACADARRLILWVKADNENAIAKYRNYGFEMDGLTDRIMFREAPKP